VVALIAAGIATGMPWAALLLTVAAWRWPFAAAPLALALAFARHRGTDPAGPAVRLVTVAAELRSGAGIRSALAAAVDEPGLARGLARGRAWEELRPGLRVAFGPHGPSVLAAVGVLRRTGGSAARVFAELADDAIAEAELAGERRAAAAPVVAQGAVVGGLPLLVLVHGAVSGRFAEIAARGSLETWLVITGAAATLVGLLTVGVVLRREVRR
jgi:hypothetical protein